MLPLWSFEGIQQQGDNDVYRVPNLDNVTVPAAELKRIQSTANNRSSWLSDISFYVLAKLLQVSLSFDSEFEGEKKDRWDW